jgi:UDP-N-acetylglucosamine 2-epimerase (non-hydrolysing)
MEHMPIKLICVAGARPNFMKLAPLLHALRENPAFQFILVHTGQHYDEKMSGRFFVDLAIPAPDFNLEVGSGTHAQQTAEIMKRFEPVAMGEAPDAVVVVGDVNSTAACALVAAKLQIPVVHVEAGLRSFDRGMPEEINRIVTDALTDVFLVTEESGRKNLLVEGVCAEKIHIVGNLMIDSLRRHAESARSSDILQRLGGCAGEFGLVTLHRPANVDDPAQLDEIMGALSEIANAMPLYFPVHPRTRARLEAGGIGTGDRIRLVEPLGYVDFLCLMSNSALVLTDSGGIQEETTVLGVPCLTLRNNTERPVTIDEGTNLLAGTSRESILAAWKRMKQRPKRGCVPRYWDGKAAERCVAVLRDYFSARGKTGLEPATGPRA